jgi:enhancing lycopene biosynthesis protein 2
MSKRIAVILAGCGYLDGAEVHEATMTLLALDQAGAQVQCFAPDIPQMHVVNHISGEEVAGEKRNVMIEAARICRGNILDLAEYSQSDFDALIMPGGFGAAKNLCDFAVEGGDMQVQEDVQRAVTETHAAGKPIGALCIAPVIVAKLIKGVHVTVGQDEGVATAVTGAFGGKHSKTGHGEIIIDRENKIVTTPCYMLEPTISQVYEGANNLVKAVLAMA